MRATLIVILAALLIASAQQATQTPAAAPQKKGAAAKQDPTKGAQKKTFTFSDTIQLVVIDVFAKDKSGNPIEGLKPEDFAVSEDGKPQKITTFQYQELKNAPEPAEETSSAAPSLTSRGTVLSEAKKVDAAAAAVKSVTAAQITPAKAGEVKYKDR